MLRAGRLGGLKFKRQVPLGRYIADFICFEEKLIVEVDGGQHSGSAADAERDRFFASEGFQTLRVWNTDALTNRDGIARAILVAVGRDPLSAATNSLRS
jgi:very-short-patch-repair endonuclease